LTAQNVIARHNLLEGAIGTFEEEKQAHWIVTLLMWLLPTIVVAGAAIDAILVIVYLKYAHPWKGILAKEKGEIVKKNNVNRQQEYANLILFQIKLKDGN
jgi:hydrogenase-4 membrane subunit HyfE